MVPEGVRRRKTLYKRGGIDDKFRILGSKSVYVCLFRGLKGMYADFVKEEAH